MKLDGRRTSSNVDDRRRAGKTTAGLGIGGLIIVGLIAWLTGGNPLEVIMNQFANVQQTGTYIPSAEDEAMAVFASQILAGTEDVWTQEFKKMGRVYTPAKMILFSGSTTSGYGTVSSKTGPFYSPAEQTVYLDLSFFNEMRDKYGAGGDFAYAYVIAHEVGHHVQYQLGILQEVDKLQRTMSKTESNQLNVRLELQADFYAGIWAYYERTLFNSLEENDIDEGLNAASAIGDDRLQMQAQGFTVPDSFNHGTSAQRSRWLKKGYTTGNVADGDTYSIPYSSL